jgi:transcriptional regulator with PAS, ATPase and Fis domain
MSYNGLQFEFAQVVFGLSFAQRKFRKLANFRHLEGRRASQGVKQGVIHAVNETNLIGESAAMVSLRREIKSAARTQAKVLVLGETGAGKEVVARLIHARGARSHRRFIAVNCCGVPETLLESELFGHKRGSFTGAYRDKPGVVQVAEGGTLLLDELGEMSLRMQAVLLRFVETGEVQPIGAETPSGRVDVRIIAATNCDLGAQIDAKTFREDLFYRLNVIQVRVPPLREREGDAVALMRFYLKQASETHGQPIPELAPTTESLLARYAWPGNVRELKNVAERLVVRQHGKRIDPDDLPVEIREGTASPRGAVSPTPTAIPAAAAPVPTIVDDLWTRLTGGDSFWTIVHRRFKSHDLTRDDLRALINRGLTASGGNYRRLLELFNMPDRDYKRFLAFLYQYDCNPAFQPHRARAATTSAGSGEGVEYRETVAV